MQRGDIVVVAASGDYGKPRPAVVIQTNAIAREHSSVIVCQMTSVPVDAPDLRVMVEADGSTGLTTLPS